MSDFHVMGISGSLRAASLNSALLREAAASAPDGIAVEIYDRLADIPPYNEDNDGAGAPEPVLDLRRRIVAADGILIASPEYNYNIPGQLKNAIDWASRPAATSVLRHKPVALMGASPSPFGTVRAQLALRQVFLWIESTVVVRPEVHVYSAHTRFDDAGLLTDATTRGLTQELLESLRRLALS
jgi:chromate reductase